jgi:hypothetical protein
MNKKGFIRGLDRFKKWVNLYNITEHVLIYGGAPFGHTIFWWKKMFLGKLWVRIKGEFLVTREDLLEGLDSGKTGKKLLNKIQTILKGETPARPEETPESESNRREIHDLVDKNYEPKSMKEMERARHELKEAQDQEEDPSPNHNPRKLG